MYDENNVPGPEYRVRPVVRYVVTRYCHPYQYSPATNMAGVSMPGGSEVVCEVPSEGAAYDVARAMAKSEERFGATVAK